MQNPNDRLAGRKPIEFIQHTAPIVILDEPQNMETEIARAAIGSLEPLCTLRYSATHRNLYNLLYRLDPVKELLANKARTSARYRAVGTSTEATS